MRPLAEHYVAATRTPRTPRACPAGWERVATEPLTSLYTMPGWPAEVPVFVTCIPAQSHTGAGQLIELHVPARIFVPLLRVVKLYTHPNVRRGDTISAGARAYAALARRMSSEAILLCATGGDAALRALLAEVAA